MSRPTSTSSTPARRPRRAAHPRVRAKLVVRAAKAHPGGLVVRLMDGDPAVFNGLAEEATACVKAGIAFEVVPGVSSVTAVPSYAGVPLTASASTGVHVVAAGARGSRPRRRGRPGRHRRRPRPARPRGRRARGPGRCRPRRRHPGGRHRARHQHRAAHRRHDPGRGRAGSMADGRFPVLAVVGSTVTMRETLSWFETKPLFGWEVLVPAHQGPVRLDDRPARAPRCARPPSCRRSPSSRRARRSSWSAPSRAW